MVVLSIGPAISTPRHGNPEAKLTRVSHCFMQLPLPHPQFRNINCYMKRNSQLSGVLHVLLHMAEQEGPATSEVLAKAMGTNPVVIRRIMGGLRRQGFVFSQRGHGGGWRLSCDLRQLTLLDIHKALGSLPLLAISNRTEAPGCLVEQAVNAALDKAFREAETLILARFGAVTLAALSADFHKRLHTRRDAHHPEATHAEGPRRYVPGLADLHRMTTILLAEHAPETAHVLVLGAGGGLELKAIAGAHTRWTFEGVDPAGPMLKLAEHTLGPLASRVTFRKGYIEDASEGPFDAATCLLTLHFLNTEERMRTLSEIHRRLKPGAPFVAAHSSFPQDETERPRWLRRYAAFAVSSGADPVEAENARASVEGHLNMLDPAQDEALLREAGFQDVSLFYAAFTWRGWIAHA
jgi:tRNA (cmo5U34)-methyltransferase